MQASGGCGVLWWKVTEYGRRWRPNKLTSYVLFVYSYFYYYWWVAARICHHALRYSNSSMAKSQGYEVMEGEGGGGRALTILGSPFSITGISGAEEYSVVTPPPTLVYL